SPLDSWTRAIDRALPNATATHSPGSRVGVILGLPGDNGTPRFARIEPGMSPGNKRLIMPFAGAPAASVSDNVSLAGRDGASTRSISVRSSPARTSIGVAAARPD